MAELIKPETDFSPEEILRTEIVVYRALIDILITKQIISEAELVNSIGKSLSRSKEDNIQEGERHEKDILFPYPFRA